MKLFYRFSRSLFNAYFKLFYSHEVFGREHFIEGRAILAPNHASYFDPPLVGVSWPEEVAFLARKSLFKFPFFGMLIRRLNAFPVSGSAEDLGSIKLICRLLNENKKVVIFPEGRRTEDGSLGDVKPGIAMLAFRCRAPIIPVYIGGSFDVWNINNKFPHLKGKTVCIFGSAINCQQFDAMEKKHAQEAMANSVKQAIASLKSWYETGAIGSPP
jgi:1-acyl-sn-glycerol-3-phosphate acyltransferase